MPRQKTFSEFRNDAHRAQAEELLLELGSFIVAFERVCECMRSTIIQIFHSEGLQHQGLSQVIVGDKASAELQILLGALFSELSTTTDTADQQAVHDLLAEIKKLTGVRNRVAHSAWRFGNNAAMGELYATSNRPRTKQKMGAVSELQGISAQYLRSLTKSASAIQVKLQRLNYCLLQKGFKVSVELTKPL